MPVLPSNHERVDAGQPEKTYEAIAGVQESDGTSRVKRETAESCQQADPVGVHLGHGREIERQRLA